MKRLKHPELKVVPARYKSLNEGVEVLLALDTKAILLITVIRNTTETEKNHWQ